MKSKILASAVALVASFLCSLSVARATTFFVDAQSDIFLAGQSSIPSFGGGAGLLPPSITVSSGQTVTITATGIASCCSGGSPNGPDGQGGSSFITGYGNVGSYSGVILPLVGVFLGAGGTPSPFVIGSSDSLVVPVGASQLYFGLPDALGFNNPPGYYGDNTGGFDVTVNITGGVPETSTWAMMILGFVGVGFTAFRRRKPVSALDA